jgi:hypothetical protein
MAWKQWLHSAKPWFDTVVGVGILATLVIAVIAYYDAHKASQVATTLIYFERYRSYPLIDSTLKLQDAYLSPVLTDIMKNAQAQDLNDFDNKVSAFISSQKLTKDTILMSYYYSDVFDCVKKNICSLEYLPDGFVNDFRTFYIMSHGLIDGWNRSDQWTYGPDSNSRMVCTLQALWNSGIWTDHRFDQASIDKQSC